MMEDGTANRETNQQMKTDAPQLATVLREIKQGLELVTSKVQSLTAKVKADDYPTADGISYLEAKHLLLLNYCQSLVYCMFRKARGLSIENHPVIHKLVETRLFLEKVRPIDKKLDYQIQKLIRDASSPPDQANAKESNATSPDDPLKYRPNPHMLSKKSEMTNRDAGGAYRPPKIAPAKMEEDNKTGREKRNAFRKEKDIDKRSKHGYMKEVLDDLQGKPEEVIDSFGHESKEFDTYRRQWDEREKQEEDLFTRAPITKAEKQKLKRLKKSRGGLLGLTDDFYNDIKSLPLNDGAGEEITGSGSRGMRKHKKQKRH